MKNPAPVPKPRVLAPPPPAGRMSVADGVTGTLANETHKVTVSVSVPLEENGKVVERLDLLDGDGVCMAVHGWMAGDFGTSPVLEPVTSPSRR